MRNRPDEIDQVRIAWENAQESIRQEIGVMSMRSFADLYYAGVQAERIARFRKPTQVQKKGTQSAYAPKVATSSSSVVANIRPPRQFSKFSIPFEKLAKSGVLKPLEPRPLPDVLPPTHKPNEFCKYHQQAGHNTDVCYKLRHAIQDLIDQGKIPNPEQSKPTGEAKRVMVISGEAIDEDYLMKQFERANSKKRAREERNLKPHLLTQHFLSIKRKKVKSRFFSILETLLQVEQS